MRRSSFPPPAIWTAAIVVGFSIWSSAKSLEQPPEKKQPDQRLLVHMTLLPEALLSGAVCLDGSPPAYHLHRGHGAGIRNWLLQFEGGGWCNDVSSCLERSRTRRGSTKYMNKLEVFSGILSNDCILNPDFCNWNRVKLRYCDGASFAGDSEYSNGIEVIYFRGRRIWDAIINDLLTKGLMGCSAGGLATFLHCDGLARVLPEFAILKCMSDGGFFLDVKDISGNDSISTYFHNLVILQGVQSSLNNACMAFHLFPYKCIFPQYNLPFIGRPYFILNTAYDVYQFHHIFVPPSADIHGNWNPCKANPVACTPDQLKILHGFRQAMLTYLKIFAMSRMEGMFINSCFAHCQSELQETWYSQDSPRIHNKTIAQAVGDWYFERGTSKEVDCPYPCDHTCQNLIPSIHMI
ncbi:hypothetical protein AXF42_Ash020649 [Apostasia shenzhenica]|uniref:Pectin acetylesterase n=1 Tax=Apostasia shenzhenica TaxID=1088818 RepID=A0A2H9ZYA1_9ASPA|nr:hypothetical protein AXF42_Ash020649 [Apostasia shenzhenica]